MIFEGESSKGRQFPEKKRARLYSKDCWEKYLRSSDFEDRARGHLRDFLSVWSSTGRQPGRILAYLPLPDELDFLDLLVQTGRPVYIPRVLSPTRMEFRLLSLDLQGRPENIRGYGGIPGGREEQPILQFPLESKDLVVLPSLATAAGGERLGRGGGYYDRMGILLLPAMIVTILPYELTGLNFPVESHDLRVNRVITEAGAVDY